MQQAIQQQPIHTKWGENEVCIAGEGDWPPHNKTLKQKIFRQCFWFLIFGSSFKCETSTTDNDAKAQKRLKKTHKIFCYDNFKIYKLATSLDDEVT